MNVIELDIEEINLDDFEVGGYDEFQLLAEHNLIREQQEARRQREYRRENRSN